VIFFLKLLKTIYKSFLASFISIFLKQLQWELDKLESSNFFLS